VCEAALGHVIENHVIENKAEATYRRGDVFNKRRKLVEACAACCAPPSGRDLGAFAGRDQIQAKPDPHDARR
jgi:hypothetical protein